MRAAVAPGRCLVDEFSQDQPSRVGSGCNLPRRRPIPKARPIFFPVFGPCAASIPSLSRDSYLDLSPYPKPKMRPQGLKQPWGLSCPSFESYKIVQGDFHEEDFRYRFSRTRNVCRSSGDNCQPGPSPKGNLLQHLLWIRLRLLLTGLMLRLKARCSCNRNVIPGSVRSISQVRIEPA
jgi:hypothetical protein